FSLFTCCSNNNATTTIYTLSLHDALPILSKKTPTTSNIIVTALIEAKVIQPFRPKFLKPSFACRFKVLIFIAVFTPEFVANDSRSEEHTSELQSRENLVCRLLLEKKKKKQ